MKSMETLSLLRKHFPGPQQAEIVRALSRDSLVWQAVQNPEIFHRAANLFKNNVQLWSPGNLALICLDVSFTSAELTCEPLATLDPDLRQAALGAFEKYRGSECSLISKLEEAGLIALAIRERFRILNTWEGILDQFEALPETNLGITLACLLAYVPEPAGLLEILASTGKHLPAVLNAIYAQPGNDSEHAHRAAQIITHGSYPARLSALQKFNLERPVEAEKIAHKLFHSEKLEYLSEGFQKNPLNSHGGSALDLLPRQLYEAEISRLAGKSVQAFRLLENITRSVDDIQRELNQRKMEEAYASGNLLVLDELLKNGSLLNHFDPGFLASFGLLLINEKDDERAIQLLRFENEIPALWIVEAARLHRTGNAQQARVLVQQQADPNLYSYRYTPKAVLILGQLLLDLGLTYESSRFITNQLGELPADEQLLFLLGKAELACGLYPDALDHARLLSLLAPENIEVNRLLAQCLEQNNLWEEALQERQHLVQKAMANPQAGAKSPHHFHHSTQDQRDYAVCALNAGEVEGALEVCWGMLEKQPDDGLAHHTLGTIFARKGEAEIALQHFIQANQLSPDYAPAWLDLAGQYNQSGDLNRAVETLRTAVQALPGDPSLHLALGERLLDAELPTQAQVELKKAAELIGIPGQETIENDAIAHLVRFPDHISPLEAQILLKLGMVLLELGQSSEACHFLHRIYQCQEYRSAAAYTYARALAATGNEREALSALSTAYLANPDDHALALEYARLLGKIGEAPDQTVQVLERLLQDNPQLTEAIGLQAEALAAVGRYADSLGFYQKAMETTLMGDPRWATRLALGLSHVAIQVGQTEIAIAALQEAIQTAPNHLALLQKLTEACQAANLPEDALEAAERALEIAPANLENLEWYARQMAALKEPKKALAALKSAVDLSPRNASLLINLGQAYGDLNYPNEAHESYLNAVNLPSITLPQLLQAVQALLDLGDAHQSVISLEKVHEIALQNSAVGQKILYTLCEAYSRLGNPDSALQILDEVLAAHPESIDALFQKSLLHKSNSQFSAALACLKQILTLDPDVPEAHLLAVEVYQAVGNLFAALEHARLASKSSRNNEPFYAYLKTAELAWQLYLPDESRTFLAHVDSHPDHRGDIRQEIKARFLGCLLETNHSELPAAVNLAEYLEQTKNYGPEFHAINALINAHQSEFDRAEQEISACLEKLDADHQLEDLILDLLCLTSYEMDLLQKSLEISEMWSQNNPSNPRATGSMVRAWVAIAENTRLLDDIDATFAVNPIFDATGKVQSRFDLLIGKLLVQLGLPGDLQPDQIINHTSIPDALKRLYIRGKAVQFIAPDQDSTLKETLITGFADYAKTSGDISAYAAFLRHSGSSTHAVQIASQLPNQSAVMIQLALAYLDISPQQALGAALSALETCNPVEDKQRIPVINTLIAKSAELAGEPAQAYQAIETALEDWPEQPAWQKFAFDIARKLGKISEAQQHLEKACAAEPQNMEYQMALGELYLENGALTRGMQIYENLGDRYPSDARIWVRLAQIKSDRGDLQGAQKALSHALELQPKDPTIQLFSAELSYLSKEFEQAANKARVALSMEPENPAAAFLLARSLAGLNRRQEGMAVLDQALTYSNRPVELYLERIRLVRSIQGIQPAHQSLLALSRQNPDHPAILALLAEFYLDQGLSQEAFSTASHAIQIGNGHLRADETSRLHTILGRILRRTGQLDQAIHQYALALQYSPSQIDLYLELGKVHTDRRQMQEALDIYEKAIDIAPDDPRPYQQAGIALKEGKDYPGAEKMIRRAAELAPHDISIHRLLGSLVALNLVHNTQ